MTQLPIGLNGTLHAEVVSVDWNHLAGFLLSAYKATTRRGALLEASNDTFYWVPPRSKYDDSLENEQFEDFIAHGHLEHWYLPQLIYRAIEDGHLPNLPYVVRQSW